MSQIQFKGFLETSFVDWPGKITAVVFLPGCSFNCGWCHNRKLFEDPDELPDISMDYVIEKIQELSDFVDGVTVSGGEPAIHTSLPEIVRQLKTVVPVKLDTNGYQPTMLRDLFEEGLLAGVSMDIKAPLKSSQYSNVVSVPVDINIIRESIQLILDAGIWYEFRTTVVPGLHSEEDINRICRELNDLAHGSLQRPLKIQKYKPI